jgi:hypothetical protein
MAQIDAPNAQFQPNTGQDWWTANAPPSADAAAAPSGNWSNTGFFPTPTGAPPPTIAQTAASSSGPPTLDIHDPASVAAYVSYYAGQPGANPSLGRDPNYWIQKISSGELGTDPNYIIGKFMTPEGAPAGGGPGAMTNPGALPETPFGGIGSTPSPYVAPTWTGGPAPTAPQLQTFTAPTEAQLEASPGYQSRLAAGLQARNRSAAAQGSVLNGGTQEALARYGQDYASNEYSNLFGQSLATNQNNNNVTQGNFGNAFQTYQANYGAFTDAANRGFNAYQANVGNARNAGNDYWAHLNDLYQTGASTAAGSYKPSNVP